MAARGKIAWLADAEELPWGGQRIILKCVRLSGQAGMAWAEPNFRCVGVKQYTPNDTYFTDQWLRQYGESGSVAAQTAWDLVKGDDVVIDPEFSPRSRHHNGSRQARVPGVCRRGQWRRRRVQRLVPRRIRVAYVHRARTRSRGRV